MGNAPRRPRSRECSGLSEARSILLREGKPTFGADNAARSRARCALEGSGLGSGAAGGSYLFEPQSSRRSGRRTLRTPRVVPNRGVRWFEGRFAAFRLRECLNHIDSSEREAASQCSNYWRHEPGSVRAIAGVTAGSGRKCTSGVATSRCRRAGVS